VLTVRQPYASLLVDGIKTVENRSWSTRYRGLLWIHAGKAAFSVPELVAEFPGEYPRGVLLGLVRLADVQTGNLSRWAEADCFHWCVQPVFRLATPVEMPGQQGLWKLGW